MTEIRQKEQLEKIKESKGVNFEEDDDDFIIDLNSNTKQTSKVSNSITSGNQKEIKPNQSQQNIEPIRKNLYIEAKEIT
jgi:hypothetical protein